MNTATTVGASVAAAIGIVSILIPFLPIPTTKSGTYYVIWTTLNAIAQNYRNAKNAKLPKE